VAAGNLSVVIGSHGKALHESSAVLAFNASGDTSCASQGDGTVNICASGGLYVNGVHFTNATTALKHATASNEAAISQLHAGDTMLWANASAQQSVLQDHGRKFEGVQAALLKVQMNATMLFDWLTVHSTDLEALGANASLQWSLITGLEHEDVRLWRASQSLDGGIATLNETTANHRSDIDVLTHAVGSHDVAIASLNLTATAQQSAIDNLTVTTDKGFRSDTLRITGLQEASQDHSDAIDLLHIYVAENGLKFDSINATTHLQRGIIGQLNSTNFQQQIEIAELKSQMFVANDTISAQQLEIDELRYALDAVNDTIISLKLAIDHVTRVSSFAPVAEVSPSTVAGTTSRVLCCLGIIV